MRGDTHRVLISDPTAKGNGQVFAPNWTARSGMQNGSFEEIS